MFDMIPFDSPSLLSGLPHAATDQPEAGTADLVNRTASFSQDLDAQVAEGGYPFGCRLLTAPGPIAQVRHVDGSVYQGINCASEDSLNLSAHPGVKAAAIEAIERHGLHGAGAPVFAGSTPLTDELEAAVAEHLRMPHVTLAPTGWAAGFGLIRALVGETDHVLLDQFAHGNFHDGAAAATRRVQTYRHLDLAHARLKLSAIRARDPRGGILVVTESLFPATSDAPDLAGFQSACREFGARLVVGVAHDCGSVGPDGTGMLGQQNVLGRVDLVVGSFAKVFASNGGFIAAQRREVRDFLRHRLPASVGSSAMSPVHAASALAAMRIVRSPEGTNRRHRLAEAARAVRAGLIQHGVEVMGAASPLVPVLIGRNSVARTAARLLAQVGVIVNVLEHPLVPRASARLRLQMMSAHTPEMAAEIVAQVSVTLPAARQPRRDPGAVRVA